LEITLPLIVVAAAPETVFSTDEVALGKK